MAEWFETFFSGLYAQVLPKTFDDARTARQVRLVRRLLKLRKGQRVLDIPCGVGRLTFPLARAGMAMTGVDLTAPYLSRARRRARREGLDVRFVHTDMREIDFDGEFHAAFNWFGSFGYFSDADNLAFCQRVWQALRPGGRFLVEGLNKSWLMSHFRPHSEETIGGVHIEHRVRYDKRADRVRSVWTLRKGRRTERHELTMWIFNGAQIRTMLRAAGYTDIRLYDRNYPATRFTRHSRRIIAVAERPKR